MFGVPDGGDREKDFIHDPIKTISTVAQTYGFRHHYTEGNTEEKQAAYQEVMRLLNLAGM